MNNTLAGNLGPAVTEQDIRSMFEEHGTVDRLKIMTDRWTGLPRGIAFVEMANDAAAAKAVAALNGKEWKGKVLKVNQARPQIHRAR